jgi:hypothetical protein
MAPTIVHHSLMEDPLCNAVQVTTYLPTTLPPNLQPTKMQNLIWVAMFLDPIVWFLSLHCWV